MKEFDDANKSNNYVHIFIFMQKKSYQICSDKNMYMSIQTRANIHICHGTYIRW